MNTYLLLKFIHIVSSVLLVGTGLGSAYYMFFGNRTGSVEVKAAISRLVVRADWWFTTPTVLIQPLTGFAMVYVAGFPITTPWIMLSIGLYLFAGACWLPVVWLQIQMAKLAAEAHTTICQCPSVTTATAYGGNGWATQPLQACWAFFT